MKGKEISARIPRVSPRKMVDDTSFLVFYVLPAAHCTYLQYTYSKEEDDKYYINNTYLTNSTNIFSSIMIGAMKKSHHLLNTKYVSTAIYVVNIFS